MRFILFMRPNVTDRWEPNAEEVAAMTTFNEALVQAGVLLAADGFHPPAEGAWVTFADGEPEVAEVPTETAVGGYWLIDVATKDEAVDWASRCPAGAGDVIEVRRVFEMDDFPEDVQAAAELSAVPPEQTAAKV